MKVYVLVLDFAMDGTHDTSIEIYATKEKAYERMSKEYEEFRPLYLGEYEESEILSYIDHDSASICLEDRYDEQHDSWMIVEREVIQ